MENKNDKRKKMIKRGQIGSTSCGIINMLKRTSPEVIIKNKEGCKNEKTNS